MWRFLILGALLLTLAGCYEADVHVVLPSEGVRLDNLKDGVYRVRSGGQTFRVRLRWNKGQHGFDVEELNGPGLAGRRSLLRIMPIEPPFYVAERGTLEGEDSAFDISFVSITDRGLRRFEPGDTAVEDELAGKNGVQLRRTGSRTRIAGSLHALRDFLAAVADSETLKETPEGYRFLGRK